MPSVDEDKDATYEHSWFFCDQPGCDWMHKFKIDELGQARVERALHRIIVHRQSSQDQLESR
jgi:hypothetical protein